MTHEERTEVTRRFGSYPAKGESKGPRADLLNMATQTIYDKHVFLNDMLEDLHKLETLADECIRNAYELYSVDTHVPLLTYHHLATNEPDDWGITREQHHMALHLCTKACHELHGKEDDLYGQWQESQPKENDQ